MLYRRCPLAPCRDRRNAGLGRWFCGEETAVNPHPSAVSRCRGGSEALAGLSRSFLTLLEWKGRGLPATLTALASEQWHKASNTARLPTGLEAAVRPQGRDRTFHAPRASAGSKARPRQALAHAPPARPAPPTDGGTGCAPGGAWASAPVP